MDFTWQAYGVSPKRVSFGEASAVNIFALKLVELRCGRPKRIVDHKHTQHDRSARQGLNIEKGLVTGNGSDAGSVIVTQDCR